MNSIDNQLLDHDQVTLQTTYATFSARLGAVIIDVLVLAALGFVVGSLVGSLGIAGGEYVGYLLGLAYNISLHYTRGATVGKMAVKIRVINVDGGPLTLEQAFTREFFTYIYIATSIVSTTLMSASMRGTTPVTDPSLILNDLFGLWMLVAFLGLLAHLVDAFWMLGNDRNQTLHDIIAKTYCVKSA